MPVTCVGTKPPPFDPDASPLRFDFSDDQPWLAGTDVACDTCGFGETLDEGAAVCASATGLQTAHHFVYKDGSKSGWGRGVFVCPCCRKQIHFQRELPVSDFTHLPTCGGWA